MRVHTMKIDKDVFYLCRINEDGKTFQEPIKIVATFNATNSNGDILAYGSSYPEYARTQEAITDILMSVKANDRVYYRKELPKVHNIYQTNKEDANFIVSGEPTMSKNTIDIRYKRIPNRR